MPCDPLVSPTCILGPIVGSATNSIFDQLAKWWTDSYASMTATFSKAFIKSGDISINQLQSSGLWKLEIGVGATIVAGEMLWAGARTAWTRQGEALATAIAGAIKAVLAIAMIFAVVSALLLVADQLTQAIVNASAGSSDAFAAKVAGIASSGGGGVPGAISFLIGLIGVVIVTILWIEMMIRSAGVVIVTLSSPIGAGGLVLDATAHWWRRLVAFEIALIFIKPIVALVLAVGFTTAGAGTGVQGSLVGVMILAGSVVAWPVVARLFTFFEGAFAIGGISAVLGAGSAVAFGSSRPGLWSGSRANGSQPMWASMQDAASRGGPPPGIDGGAPTPPAPAPGGFGGAGPAAAASGAPPVAAAAVTAGVVATKVVAAPARAVPAPPEPNEAASATSPPVHSPALRLREE